LTAAGLEHLKDLKGLQDWTREHEGDGGRAGVVEEALPGCVIDH